MGSPRRFAMFARCAALLIVVAIAINIEEAGAIPLDSALDSGSWDLVEVGAQEVRSPGRDLLQTGNVGNNDTTTGNATVQQQPASPYAEAISKGVAKVVEAQEKAARKQVEAARKDEEKKQAATESLNKEKTKVENNVKAGNVKSEEMKSKADE